MSYLSPSLATLEAQVDRAFPARSRKSDGWLGDRAHRRRRSEHNPDRDGSVDGLDLTHGPAWGRPELDCHRFVGELVASGDQRLQRVIWNHRIWNRGRGWSRYFGDNPHTAHCHAETTDAGQNDGRLWDLPMLTGRPPTNAIPANSTPAASGLSIEEFDMPRYMFADGREGIWWTDYGVKRWVRTEHEISDAKWHAGLVGGPTAAAAVAPRRMEVAAFDNIPVMPGTLLPPSMGGNRQPFTPAVLA